MCSILYTHPEILKFWHPTKNINITPSNITHGSGKKVWWLCPNKFECGCLHEHKQLVKSKINGTECPYCCVPPIKVCEHRSIKFKCPSIMEKWHPTKNGDLDPSTLSSGSTTKIWLLCSNTCDYGCLHEYEQTVYCAKKQG